MKQKALHGPISKLRHIPHIVLLKQAYDFHKQKILYAYVQIVVRQTDNGEPAMCARTAVQEKLETIFSSYFSFSSSFSICKY